MSKRVKVITSAIIVVLVFVSGFFVGSLSNAEVTKEIRIGYQNSDNPDRIDFPHVFTYSENPSLIDRFLLIYINKEKIENVNLDLENPDLYVVLNDVEDWVGLASWEIWFENDGAIIGERDGGSLDQMTFYRINESGTAFIKKVINDEEGKR